MRLLVLIIVMSLIAIPGSLAVLSCNIVLDNPAGTGCAAPSIVVFRMMGMTNSHAGDYTASAATHPYAVCCSASAALTHAGANVVELAATSNSNVWQPGSSQPVLIQLGPAPTVQCQVTAAACSAGYTTLASMISPANSHVGQPADYTTKICCTEGGAACPPDGTVCSVDGDCCATSYCSRINPDEGSVSPHCCRKGWYWSDITGTCRESELCYEPSDLYPCDFAPPNNPPNCPPWSPCPAYNANWWQDTNCISNALGACCYVPKYGLDPFWETTDASGNSNIKVYNRVGGKT